MTEGNSNQSGGTEVPIYLGPYEVWNFGKGRDYALPSMRRHSTHISALAELGAVSATQGLQKLERKGLLPTLWEDSRVANLSFFPFVIKTPADDKISTPQDLADLLQVGLSNVAAQFAERYLDAVAAIGPSAPAAGAAAADALLERVKQSRFRIAFPIADHSIHADTDIKPLDPEWQPDADLRKRIDGKTITVIAVIDDGLPFAHRNFRDADGTRTRVEFCWLQSARIDATQKSVLFGREYTRATIESLIAQHGDDEDALYRAAGATDDTDGLGSLIDRHATHGAHVMDLAAGYACERGEKPREEIRIIAVQLPNTIAWDTSGFGKDMYMLSAFHYIFHRADFLAQGYEVVNLRLVINFSYGFSGGRHDGETELEAAINEMIAARRNRKPGSDSKKIDSQKKAQQKEPAPKEARRQNPALLGPSPTALVLPAGNMFLDRLHGTIRHSDFDGGVAKIRWRIQPNDRTPSYLEIWFPLGVDPRGYTIELRSPSGRANSSFPIRADKASGSNGADLHRVHAVPNAEEEQVGQVSVDRHRADLSNPKSDRRGRWRILIVMAPTEPENPLLPRTEAGRWTVVLDRGTGPVLGNDAIHCWIQRSADPESLRSGSRQSYFEDCRDQRYTAEGDLAETDTDGAFIERFGSLNGLATERTSLVVGGYRLGAGLGSRLACARPARYSSAGMIDTNWPGKPVDCSSMSERSRALPGTIAAGVRSGSLSLVQGTSSAAPFVARQLAETFVIIDEDCVQEAQGDNYLCLLNRYPPKVAAAAATDGNDPCPSSDDPASIKARLGTVRVPPHWQPGIEPHPSGQTE